MTSIPSKTRYRHNPEGSTMGGRGQEVPIPEDTVQHWLTIEYRGVTSTHQNRFISAAEGLRQRAERLKGQKLRYTIDGNRLTFTDFDGIENTLTYEDAS